MKTFPQYPQIVIIGGNFGWVLAKTLAAKYKDWQILFLMRDETKVAEARASRIVDKFFGQKIRQSGNTDAAAWIALPENVSFYSLSDFRQYFREKSRHFLSPPYHPIPSERLWGKSYPPVYPLPHSIAV